ncbi:TRAP transporter small permease [Bradymonas sediminis]|nr:TRAP transporter small permease [Bradymonas sediminis]TDP76590.1 tripartite ATP-independent transporter DctQ subunit [Bradymonas sediminis]
MLKALLKFEDGLMRVERGLLVLFVIGMLLLAAYNVFYRNLLVPWQNKLMVSGPPVVMLDTPEDTPAEQGGAEELIGEDADDFGGGFGGGFGDDAAEDLAAEEVDESNDFAGGFGGGFGDDSADDSAEEEVADSNDFGGGFGGGFGDEGEEVEEGFGGGFGGGFGDDEVEEVESAAANLDEAPAPEPRAVELLTPTEVPGGPPEDGSVSAMIVGLIDALKFSWIDSLLRQLVIICGFLGAMLAARQRNHITIDIFGKMLKGRAFEVGQAITSAAAVVVCALLAVSGMDLVKLGIEFPQQVIPWITQWQFQLIFPIGWGLIGLHFLVRVFESVKRVMDNDFPQEPEEGDLPGEASAMQGGAS